MTLSWLILNFILLLLAFYLILHLYQRIRNLEQSDRTQTTEDLEAALSDYLDQVRRENDRLAHRVGAIVNGERVVRPSDAQQKDEHPQGHSATGRPSDSVRKPDGGDRAPSFNEELQKQVGKSVLRAASSNERDGSQGKNDQPWVPPVDAIQDTVEESLTARAMELHEQGLSTVEIAKKLNRGEGEIRLLLKIRERKQP
jgi:hypothetical protein